MACPGRHVEPLDLRKSDRPRRRLRRADRRRGSYRGPRSRRAVRGSRGARHPGGRRRAWDLVYEQTQRRRPGDLSASKVSPLSGDGYPRDARGGAPAVGITSTSASTLMVKVPGVTETPAPSCRSCTLIGEGININITLLFSSAGLCQGRGRLHRRPWRIRRQGRGDPHKVSSVASFFLSRIDTLVDEALRQRDRGGRRPGRETAAHRAQGQGRDQQRQGSTYSAPSRKSTAATAGSGWRKRARRRSACCGPAPAPRTRPIATSSMSRN